MQHCKLNSQSQEGGVSILDYVSALRRLAEWCEYEGNLEEMLRGRLFRQIANDHIQRRLLMEALLDFDKPETYLLQWSLGKKHMGSM